MSQPLICTHSDLYNEFYTLLGSKISFKTTDGEYEGILKLILPKKQRVTFEHVYYVPTREYMGNLHFFFHEFLSYDVIQDAERSENYEKWSYLSHILDRKFVNNHYRPKDLFNGELDETQSEAEENIPFCDEGLTDDFVFTVPPQLKNELPGDSLILNACNDEFEEAINYLLKQPVIGVSFDGPKISRFGKLSWICISSPDCVFLYDIELLGESAFLYGLKKLFEDKSIEKVIHDCRQPSDCLANKYKTELNNVFDTQVADYIVNLQRYTDKPDYKYVSSLDCCLVSHLQIPQEYLYSRRKHISYAEEENFFKIRPLSNEFRNVIIKNALYLIKLRNTLSELMISPFRNAVDIYLKVLANASEPELLLEPSVPDKLPPALVFQGIQTVRFQEFPKMSAKAFKCDFIDPRSERIISIQKTSERDVSNHLNMCSVGKDSEIAVVKSDLPASEEPKIKHNRLLKNNKPETEVVDQLCFSGSRAHIDSIYHHLAGSITSLSSAVNIDVKPSDKFVSNFTVTKPREIIINTESKSVVHGTKANNCDSAENEIDTSSEASVDTSVDSNDSWSQLRSAFSSSCNASTEESESSRKGKRFLPAGMKI